MATRNIFNPQRKLNFELMVPVVKMKCLRCDYQVDVVWSAERQQAVDRDGGLPCPNCDPAPKKKKNG